MLKINSSQVKKLKKLRQLSINGSIDKNGNSLDNSE